MTFNIDDKKFPASTESNPAIPKNTKDNWLSMRWQPMITKASTAGGKKKDIANDIPEYLFILAIEPSLADSTRHLSSFSGRPFNDGISSTRTNMNGTIIAL
jgi:hypothetical protein